MTGAEVPGVLDLQLGPGFVPTARMEVATRPSISQIPGVPSAF